MAVPLPWLAKVTPAGGDPLLAVVAPPWLAGLPAVVAVKAATEPATGHAATLRLPARTRNTPV